MCLKVSVRVTDQSGSSQWHGDLNGTRSIDPVRSKDIDPKSLDLEARCPLLTFRRLLLWSLALTLGCSKNAPQAVEKVKAIEEKSTPQVRVTEEDFKILDVVLLDLLDFEGYKILHPTKIVLDPITAGDFDHAQENQLDVEALSARNQDISAELRGDLRRRNPEKPISLAGYKSSSSRILLRKGNLTAPGEEITEAVAYARRFSICGRVRRQPLRHCLAAGLLEGWKFSNLQGFCRRSETGQAQNLRYGRSLGRQLGESHYDICAPSSAA